MSTCFSETISIGDLSEAHDNSTLTDLNTQQSTVLLFPTDIAELLILGLKSLDIFTAADNIEGNLSP